MPKRVNNIPSAGHKKRKEVSVSANNESGPPKKKYRNECRVDDCTNIVQKGGVCWRHGARVERKRCSVKECTNYVQKGGVCWRHGARVEHKLCSVKECTNIVQKGGVCWRHGAKKKLCSFDECTNHARKGGVCTRHGAQKKRCSIDGCTNQRRRRGVCWRHGAYSAAPPAQGNFLCGDVQGGGNQNDVSTVVEVSDNEEEGGKKQSPIAGRKRKADNVGKQSKTAASNYAEEDGPVHPTRRSTRLSTLSKPNYNLDAAYNDSGGNVDGNEEGKEATDRAPSDVRPQKRARGEGNLNDDKEQDASDVAPVKEGEGGIGDEMEVVDNWGGDGQNEYDCEGDDNGDVNSVEGKHSHVVPEEITAIDNDVEKDSEIQRLTRELKDSNNTVITLKDQLKEISTELEAIKSRSKSEHERTELLRSKLNGVNAQIAELEEELEAETAKKAEMDTQLMTSVKTRLEERVAKDAANAKLRESKNKFDAAKLELNDATSQLKLKSDDVAKLKKEVAELKKVNASLQNQLENQSNVGGIEVKEEELTDDEDFTARLKQRRTERSPEMQS